MNINAQQTVADVVTANIKAAHIFKKYGIDFCCGGGISIAKACEKKSLNAEVLIAELNRLHEQPMQETDFKTFSANDLAKYIVNTHHAYVLSSFSLLDAYITKVVKVHGHHHEALYEISNLYDALKHDLTAHLQKEERILFPYIQYLLECKKNGIAVQRTAFGTVASPIGQMQLEHEEAGELMRRISDLTMQYTPPDWACNTFKALYAKLHEFETDLHIHVHLENNILFHKAIELEQSFS